MSRRLDQIRKSRKAQAFQISNPAACVFTLHTTTSVEAMSFCFYYIAAAAAAAAADPPESPPITILPKRETGFRVSSFAVYRPCCVCFVSHFCVAFCFCVVLCVVSFWFCVVLCVFVLCYLFLMCFCVMLFVSYVFLCYAICYVRDTCVCVCVVCVRCVCCVRVCVCVLCAYLFYQTRIRTNTHTKSVCAT